MRPFALVFISLFVNSKLTSQELNKGCFGLQISSSIGQVDDLTPNLLKMDKLFAGNLLFFYNHLYFRYGIKGAFLITEDDGGLLFSGLFGYNFFGKQNDPKKFLGPTLQFGKYHYRLSEFFGKYDFTFGVMYQYKGFTISGNGGISLPNYKMEYTSKLVKHWYIELGYTYCFKRKKGKST